MPLHAFSQKTAGGGMAVVINEIFPKTADVTYEWIELYNNGSDSVSLDRWKLQNTSSSTTYGMNASVIIPGRSFLTLYQPQTGITLSVNGDTVKLIDENGNQQDSQSYPGILGFNMSMGRSSDGGGSWVECKNVTPNLTNDCPAPTITPTPLPSPIPTSTVVPTPTEAPTPTLEPAPTTLPTLTPTQSILPSPTGAVLAAVATKSATQSQWQLLGLAGIAISLIWMVVLVIIMIRRRRKQDKQASH